MDIRVPEQEPQLETRPRKRRRRTVACTQCRTRKLKCDREYPTCSRCIKSGTPAKCTYEDGFLWQQPKTVASSGMTDRFSSRITLPPPNGPVSASPPDSTPAASNPPPSVPTGGGTSRARFLDTVLESPTNPMVNRWPRTPDGEPSSWNTASQQHGHEERGLASPSQQLDLPNKVIIRGKETKTRFNGGGIIANLMLQFPQLKPFIAELKSSNPSVKRMHRDLDMVKRGHHKAKLKEPIPVPDTETLISLLPSRPAVDELFELYLLYVESIHRVIHIPSFRQELEEMWAKKDNPDAVSPAFVVQLLLILASAAGFFEAERPPEIADSAITRSLRVLDWIRYAEKWIDTANIKRPDLTVLRIHCLLIIAKNNQGLNRSRAWLSTGMLVKLAMLAGYHRDPDHIPKITVFNKEMRRRIWTTIIELDLQIALDRGMPPTLQRSDFDTQPPLNINDDEVDESMVEAPRSRPLHEITDMTFPSVLAQSLPLRLRICALMNSPVISCSYEDIQKLEWELGRFQASLPTWPAAPSSQLNHKLILWRALLETKLAQGLLAIHTPFAIEANKDPLFEPSSRARLEVATVILSRQLRLHEISMRLSFSHLSDSTLQASLSILQHLYAAKTGYTSSLLRQVLPVFTESLLSLVEKTLSCMENKLLIVKGAKQFFFLHMILALVKAKLWPDQAALLKKSVIDRIGVIAYNLLVHHQENSANDAEGQAPGQAPGSVPTPRDSTSAFDGTSLPDLAITPPENLNALLEAFDWEDFSTFPFAL
ncbi:hypothetical protein VTN77DRAFT_2027 [Rasamsonia byssochlamydoides]|uniref:uncharacterized protein n=1 Tax=Rasamsonia byssochlamydoides TaxID=89139 RepID=UPI0037446F49